VSGVSISNAILPINRLRKNWIHSRTPYIISVD
jgi:hypothetical protein